MNTRSWPIRTKLFALVLIPVISLIALWGVATKMAYDSARDLVTAQTGYDQATKPTEVLVGRLQQERRLSVAFLGAARTDGRELGNRRSDTDTAAAAFRTNTASSQLRKTASPTVRSRLDDTRDDLGRLAAIRQSVDQRQIDRAGAMRAYTEIIDHAYQIFLAMPGVNHPAVSVDAHAVVAASRAREALSQEDALLAGIAVAGRFTGTEPGQLAALIGTQRFLFADAVPGLASADRDAYTGILRSDPATRLRQFEDKLLVDAHAGAPVTVDMAAWQSSYDTYAEQLRQAEYAATRAVLDRADPIGVDIMVRLGLLGVLGLIAILCSMVVAHRLGVSLVNRLTQLRDLTRELASDRLPALTRRLQAGETLDLARELHSPEFGSDEVCQVGQAVYEIHRAAVESVGSEARMRAGVNKVFLNVARRSQTLLHRQLTLLDQMERDTIEPARLQALFRIDHLATRMRRHAEDLVILAGASPARGWRTPVSIIDVIRGAISEVEDYTRITLQGIPEVAVAGPAVADVIHLLSELLENASAFSPPHTPVLVSGQLVPSGLAIDIEDRGLGMPADAVQEANERLANPPVFDPTNSTRLGLFVIATLAARHHITVNLRRSPYGGITAVVLLPPELVMDDPEGPVPGMADDHSAALEAFAGRADVPAGPVTNGRPAIGPGRNRLGWGRGAGAPVGADPVLAPPTTAIPGVGSLVVPSRQGEPVRDALATSGVTRDVPPSASDEAATAEATEARTAEASAVEAFAAGAGAVGAGAVGAGAGTVEAGAGTVEAGAVDAVTVEAVTVEAGMVAVDPEAPTAEYAVIGSRATGSRTAAPAAGSQTAAVADEPGTVELTADGLPRRRRQASLAPQLRGGPETGTRPAPARPSSAFQTAADRRAASGAGQAASGIGQAAGAPGATSPGTTSPGTTGAGTTGAVGAVDGTRTAGADTDTAGAASGDLAGSGPANPEVRPTRRSPEQVRSLMSALQSGTRRGRQAADEYLRASQEIPRPVVPELGAAEPSATAAATPAPGTEEFDTAAPAPAAPTAAAPAQAGPEAPAAAVAPADQDAPGDEEEQ